MVKPGTLTVRGRDILKPPLLETSDAKSIEFRDGDGNLICFWRRVFEGGSQRELWGFCSKADPEWEEMCIRYGYRNPGPGTDMNSALGGAVR